MKRVLFSILLLILVTWLGMRQAEPSQASDAVTGHPAAVVTVVPGP